MPGTETPNPAARRRVLAALVALGCGVTLTACGSGSGSATNGASGDAAAIKYASCMRTHGVSDFPDPTAGPGGVKIGGPGSDIDPTSPAFQSAQKTCSRLMPGPSGPPRMTESAYLAALGFAKCMRGHGLPNFPDPSRSPSAGPGNTLVLRGMVFQVGGGLDPMSPAFRRAAQACGLRFP